MQQNLNLKKKQKYQVRKKNCFTFSQTKTKDVWHYEDINATKTWHQLPFWDGRIYS